MKIYYFGFIFYLICYLQISPVITFKLSENVPESVYQQNPPELNPDEDYRSNRQPPEINKLVENSPKNVTGYLRPKRAVIEIIVAVILSIGAGVAAHQINKAIDRAKRDTKTVLEKAMVYKSTELNTVQVDLQSRSKCNIFPGLVALGVGQSAGIGEGRQYRN